MLNRCLMSSLLLLATVACSPATHGVKKEGDTIYFSGTISQEAADAIVERASAEVHTLVVNSDGGDETAAIQIGNLVAQRGLTVVVDDKCHSACAQYVFVAAARKEISATGVVSCHHNSVGISEDTPRWLSGTALSRIGTVRIAASSLYQMAGVSLDFARACMTAVVPLCYCSKSGEDYIKTGYSVWIPTRRDFAKFGIAEVVGAPETVEAAAKIGAAKGLDASTASSSAFALLEDIPLCSALRVSCD
jgi:ATP-dependent protease ClpP protease subunit